MQITYTIGDDLFENATTTPGDDLSASLTAYIAECKAALAEEFPSDHVDVVTVSGSVYKPLVIIGEESADEWQTAMNNADATLRNVWDRGSFWTANA